MGGALCALLVLLVCAGCKRPPPKPPPPEPDDSLQAQVTLIGVRVHGWRGSELAFEGRAAKLTFDRSTSQFRANEALVLFPTNDEAEVRRAVNSDVELRAATATGNLNASQAEGTGGVTLRTRSGLRAETDHAHFDGVGLVAKGTSPVAVEGPGYSHDAASFTFYFVTEELLFEGGVKSLLGEVAR